MSDSFQIFADRRRGSAAASSARPRPPRASTSAAGYLSRRSPLHAGTIWRKPGPAPRCRSPSPARRRPDCTNCGRRKRSRPWPAGAGCNARCTIATSRARSAWQRDDAEDARVHPVGDRLDRAALAGACRGPRTGCSLGPRVFDPALEGSTSSACSRSSTASYSLRFIFVTSEAPRGPGSRGGQHVILTRAAPDPDQSPSRGRCGTRRGAARSGTTPTAALVAHQAGVDEDLHVVAHRRLRPS